MLVSLTVGKVDAGVTVLLTPDKRLIEFPSILLPPNIVSGSIVDITVGRNHESEKAAASKFTSLQDRIFSAFGAAEPTTPVLRCRNATQTSVVLEWDPIDLATADLISLSLYRNGQKAGNIPRPLSMHSTKISGLAVDTEYNFHLVLRTTAGTFASKQVSVKTHKMTDLSGITISMGFMPPPARENLVKAVERIGAKIVDSVRIDTTHFVTVEGRGVPWEKAVEMNIPVVRPEWVEACEKNGRILGVTKFYLDAVLPGPGDLETTRPGSSATSTGQAPATTADREKDLPPNPPAGEGEGGGEEEEETEDNQYEQVKGGDDDSEDEEDEDEADKDKEPDAAAAGKEQDKTKAADAEQKVKIENQEEQKVAIHPKPSSPAPDKDGDEEDKKGEESEDSGGKPPAQGSGDGASFQEIDL